VLFVPFCGNHRGAATPEVVIDNALQNPPKAQKAQKRRSSEFSYSLLFATAAQRLNSELN
jgi:hypothetical protein